MNIERPLIPTFAMPRMTAVERATGRYMRAPDHGPDDFSEGGDDLDQDDNSGLDDDDNQDDNDDQSGDTDDDNDADSDDDDENADDEDEGSSQDDDKAKRKPKNGYEKRIANLTKRLREAEAKTQREAPKEPKEPQQRQKPKVSDYKVYEDYVEALTEFKAEEIADKREARREQLNSAKEFQTKYEAGKKEFKDFKQVLEAAEDDVTVTPAMNQAIRDSDMPAAVVYYLAKHPEEAERIAELPANKVPLAMGRIEGKIEAAKARGGKGGDTLRNFSKAPEPITPTKGSGSSSGKDLDKMSTDEYIRYMNAKDAKKARERSS